MLEYTVYYSIYSTHIWLNHVFLLIQWEENKSSHASKNVNGSVNYYLLLIIIRFSYFLYVNRVFWLDGSIKAKCQQASQKD